jgi:hypothetical protein
MLLRNFPLNNGRPKGREQTNRYVKALDIKQEADQLATTMVEKNGTTYDLDPSPNGVALDYREIKMGANLGYGDVTGVASFQGSQEDPNQLELQADIVPDKGANRTLTRREDGDTVHYTRQFDRDKGPVEHLVHDTATDRINYFLRNDKGQFIEQ